MVSDKEDVALAMVQEVFKLFPYKHFKKLMLVKYKKEFVRRWDSLTTAGLIVTEDDSLIVD
jgi:hypothetical protein